MYFEQQQNAN